MTLNYLSARTQFSGIAKHVVEWNLEEKHNRKVRIQDTAVWQNTEHPKSDEKDQHYKHNFKTVLSEFKGEILLNLHLHQHTR